MLLKESIRNVGQQVQRCKNKNNNHYSPQLIEHDKKATKSYLQATRSNGLCCYCSYLNIAMSMEYLMTEYNES